MSAIARIALRAQRWGIARVMERLSGQLADIQVTAERDGVSIAGRAVRSDPRLRWVGGLVR